MVGRAGGPSGAGPACCSGPPTGPSERGRGSWPARFGWRAESCSRVHQNCIYSADIRCLCRFQDRRCRRCYAAAVDSRAVPLSVGVAEPLTVSWSRLCRETPTRPQWGTTCGRKTWRRCQVSPCCGQRRHQPHTAPALRTHAVTCTMQLFCIIFRCQRALGSPLPPTNASPTHPLRRAPPRAAGGQHRRHHSGPH